MKKNEAIEKRAERQREAAEAMAEYRAHEAGIGERLARLKAIRLAHADQRPLSPIPMENPMAVNKPIGDNARKGAVRKRTQLKTKVMGESKWTKRSKESGQFMDQKKLGKFKGTRREKVA